MGFIGAKIPSRALVVDLDAHGLSDEDKQWLRDAIGSEQPKKTELDTLARDPALSDAQRRTLRQLQQAIRGDLRATSGTLVSTTAAKDSKEADASGIVTFKKGVALTGEPERVQKVRDGMPEALWGHEGTLEAFRRVAKDFVSEARLTPPVLAMTGRVAHGKDQAIHGLNASLLSPKTKIVTVDFSTLTDRDVASLFADDDPEAPLSAKALKKAAGKDGVCVRINGCDDLLTRAPVLARSLQAALLARRGEAGYAQAAWVFDFNTNASTDPQKKMVAALGEAGNRVLSATARFENLDAATMDRYAMATFERLLAARSLEKVTLEIDPEARTLLAEMLTTTHAPLDELEHRLQRFVMAHFDTQTSLARDRGGVLRVTLAPRFSEDALGKTARESKAALLSALREPAAPLALGDEVFEVAHTAERGMSPSNRAELVALVHTLHEQIQTQAGLVGQAGDEDTLALLRDELQQLMALTGKARPKIERRLALAQKELISESEYEVLALTTESVSAVAGALTEAAAKDELCTLLDGFADALAALRGTERLRMGGEEPAEGGAAVPSAPTASARTVRTPLAYAAGSTGCVTRAVDETVAAAAVFPDGRMVTLSTAAKAKTWDANGVSLAKTWDNQTIVTALSGGRLATRAVADCNVNIFDEQYNRVAQLKGHSNVVTGVGELPDGSLVTTSDDGTMKVWDTSYACTMTNKLNWGEVAKLAVLTNGNLALCTRVGKLVICEPNGRVLSRHEDRTYVSVTGLSDGRFAAGTDGGRVQIFGGNFVRLSELTGHTGAVRSIVELPGGHLATGSATGTTKIWDSAGQCICTLDGHKGGVTSLACLADGRIVCGSGDGTVRIWSFGP